jgi:hypothetical protein
MLLDILPLVLKFPMNPDSYGLSAFSGKGRTVTWYFPCHFDLQAAPDVTTTALCGGVPT